MHRRKHGHRRRKNTLLVLIGLVVIALMLAAAFYLQRRAENEVIENAGAAAHGITETKDISYNGEKVRLKHQLETVLLIGVDGDEELPQYAPGRIIPYYNYQQADFLVLMIFDNEARKLSYVQINRDTMMNVPWLGATGDVGGTNFEQIALSHNSGSGLKDSCLNTSRSVSRLLFGLPVDHYVKITMGAVPVLTDIVGGVPVSIDEDLTALDPSLKKGSEVTLRGRLALSYVRARKGVSDGTNISRMHRQKRYIDSYLDRAKIAFGNDPELIVETVEALNRCMLTDMSAEMLVTVGTKISDYEEGSYYTPDGENRAGEKYYEFYVDKDLLWQKVKELTARTQYAP